MTTEEKGITTQDRPALSWQPIHAGERYCAPACGMGCTRAAFDAATAGGNDLAAELGEGWTPRVWENLGWHYSAVSPCRRLQVYPCRPDRFTAYLNSPGKGGGRWVASAAEPDDAIALVVRLAQAEIESLQSIVEGLVTP